MLAIPILAGGVFAALYLSLYPLLSHSNGALQVTPFHAIEMIGALSALIIAVVSGRMFRTSMVLLLGVWTAFTVAAIFLVHGPYDGNANLDFAGHFASYQALAVGVTAVLCAFSVVRRSMSARAP
jgi:hypothetical protein